MQKTFRKSLSILLSLLMLLSVLPLSAFAGAVFLMLADLAARTVLRPRELPIGVVTSLIGTAVFLIIFARTRKGEKI